MKLMTQAEIDKMIRRLRRRKNQLESLRDAFHQGYLQGDEAQMQMRLRDAAECVCSGDPVRMLRAYKAMQDTLDKHTEVGDANLGRAYLDLRAEVEALTEQIHANTDLFDKQDAENAALRAEVEQLRATACLPNCEDREDPLTAGQWRRVHALNCPWPNREKLDALRAENAALRAKVAPFVRFIEAYDARPMGGIADAFYSIHGGDDHHEIGGASLRLSDLRKIKEALRHD